MVSVGAPCTAHRFFTVVDRLLWRNAPGVLRRHVVGAGGFCQWCGQLVAGPDSAAPVPMRNNGHGSAATPQAARAASPPLHDRQPPPVEHLRPGVESAG